MPRDKHLRRDGQCGQRCKRHAAEATWQSRAGLPANRLVRRLDRLLRGGGPGGGFVGVDAGIEQPGARCHHRGKHQQPKGRPPQRPAYRYRSRGLCLGLRQSIRYVGVKRQIDTSLMRSPALLGHLPAQFTSYRSREEAGQSGAVKAPRVPPERS